MKKVTLKPILTTHYERPLVSCSFVDEPYKVSMDLNEIILEKERIFEERWNKNTFDQDEYLQYLDIYFRTLITYIQRYNQDANIFLTYKNSVKMNIEKIDVERKRLLNSRFTEMLFTQLQVIYNYTTNEWGMKKLNKLIEDFIIHHCPLEHTFTKS